MVATRDLDEARQALVRRRLAGRRRARQTAIPVASRAGRLPLSSGQERLWFLSQLAPDSTEYQIPVVLRLAGELDAAALNDACRQVLDRHEILRTRYRLSDARPVQVIDPPPGAIPVSDLSALAAGEREREAIELARRDIVTPFDLGLDHPVRIRLIRLASDDHILAITLHHIAADGQTVHIVLRELFHLYASVLAGQPAAMPPLPVQYADYAIWQRDRATGETLERHLGYWRKQLAGLTPLELPADRPRAAVRDWAGDRVALTVPAGLAARLRELARERQTTLFVVTLTVFQLLLARYTGRDPGRGDIAVGSAMTARSVPELQDLAGFFLDTIVLRGRWSGDPAFTTLLDLGRQTVLDGISHQEAPLQVLVEELDGGRELSRTPLFQVMFDLVEAWPDTLCLPGLQITPLDVLGAIAKHDLRLELAERPDGSLGGGLEYATALFDAATVERLAGHYLRLLEQVAADPGRPVSELDVLDAAERRRLLAEGDGGRAGRPWRPVAGAVAEWARQVPRATAVATPAGPLSYAELDRRANQVAHLLLARGLRPQSVAGVALERGRDLLPVLLGVWRAGAAYVPLDPADPPDRLGYVLRDCSAALLVTTSDHLDRFPPDGRRQVLLMDAERPRLDAQPGTDPGRLAGPDGLAYLIYTSGSTGRPKGVLVTHRALMNYLSWAAESYLVPGGAGAPLFSPVAFDLSVTPLYLPLLGGQPVHLLPPAFDLAELGALVAGATGGRYSFVKLTPAHLELLCLQLGREQAAGLAARLVVGGEGFPWSLAGRWHELAGQDAAPALINEYGPTEICVASVAQPVTGTAASSGLVPVGRPVPGTTAYVLDDGLRLMPPGATGELYLGGVQLAQGYHGSPALTARRFVADPYGSPGGRLYRTGDLARRRPDGIIEFLGRADEQIKLRGHRIEPAEIVAALRSHPDVQDAAVTVRTSGPGGAGGPALIAYVVPAAVDLAAAGRPGGGELRALAARLLPGYMVPSTFVTVPAIPLTSHGKVDYRALPAVPQPDEARPEDGRPAAPPTPVERRIAEVFAQVLGLGQAGRDDDFFDLGGDSVSAVAVVGALRDDGMDVWVRDLFEHSTVAELAAALAGRPAIAGQAHRVAPFELISAEDRARLPAGVVDAYPLSMIQRGMLFEMLGGGEVNYYHNATTYTIRDDQPFSLPALRAAAALMVQRQEMLRTGFDLVNYSCPLQLVYAAAELPVGVQDLRSLSAHDRDEAVREYMTGQQKTLFDLDTPPLFRLFAHVTAEDRWQLTITECHPILEGWGYHLMLMDLVRWYRLLRDGQPVPGDEPLPVRYADFIAAEQQSLASAADQGYWRRIIETLPRFSLPAGWGAGPGEPTAPASLQVMFVDIAGELRALAKAAEVPLKSVMHAAHLAVMSMLTSEPAFFTGRVCDTRPEVTGADRLPGLFLNTVPFPFRPGARTWRELVREVFETETELWPHRRYPVLAVHQEAGRLIDVSFNFLDFHSVDTALVDFEASIDDSYVEFQLSTTVFAQGLLTLRFHPAAISQANGERLAAMYRRVLMAMAADPDGDARASYLPPGEHRKLAGWNDTAVSYPPATLPDLFLEQARARPDAIAAVAADGRQVSYAELRRRASQLARHLRRLGVGPEVRVGLCLEHGVDLLAGVLGIAAAGGAYVPLDPGHPRDRLAFIVSDAAPAVILTQDSLRERLPLEPQPGGPVLVCLDRNAGEIAACPDDDPPPAARPDNLAYVIYTSGSTGRPKGVLVTHRGLVNYLRWAVDFCGPDGADGAPLHGSMAVDGPVTSYLVPLAGGRPVRMLPGDGDAEALADVLAGPVDFNLVKLTPAHLDLLSAYLCEHAPISSVRTVIVGGDRLTGSTVAAWRQIAPRARLVNHYGPTETVVGSTVFEVPAGLEQDRPVPIGAPIANTRVYVLDRELREVPVGVTGELYIGGTGVARGYLNDPAKTAAAFVPDPRGPVPGARCYRTGDLVRFRPDGNLEFIGRADNQIKFLGYRIEPGEIEARLRAHPDVSAAAVVLREDPPAGRRLVAYLVGAAGDPPELARLREFLGRTLPAHMLPSASVVLDALPRTRAGKVDLRALPSPDRAVASASGYVPPENATQRVIAGVWASVLGLDRVGIDDNFAGLGGHSLAAMRVSALLRASHKVLVSARDVLRHPTVRELAAVAELAGVTARAASGDGADQGGAYRRYTDGQILGDDGTLVWFRRSGTRPPLFCAHDTATLCFGHLAEELGPGRPVAALQHPAMVDPGYAGMRVEDLAALYAGSMRGAGHGGPYHLLGWCAGVPVVWELARLLAAGGSQVVLCLLDPKLGDPGSGGSISSLSRLRHCEELLGRLRADPGGPQAADLRREILDVLRGLFPDGVRAHDVQAADVDEGWPEVVRSWREQAQARLAYRFEPLEVPVHLLASDEAANNPGFFHDTESYEDYAAEWRRLASGRLTTHRVAGWHDGMLRPPLVTRFALDLAAILDAEGGT